MKISLEMAGGACSAGIEDARARFKPGKQYTLAQIIKAGLPCRYLAWIVAHRAGEDAQALEVLSAWARTCTREQGLRRLPIASVRDCGEALRKAMRAWQKANPGRTGKGARAWTHQRLVEIVNER